MKIEETFYLKLLDVYGALITPHKKDVAEMYFGLDLSLSEIAEIKSVTRQSVADVIKSVKADLDDYELKLRFVAILEELKNFSKTLPEKEGKKLIDILEK